MLGEKLQREPAVVPELPVLGSSGAAAASAKEIRLYVDGKLVGTRDWTYTPWNATGPVQIGRKLSSSTYGEFTNGAISDIRIYPTALPPADASTDSDLPKVAQLD